MHLKICIVLPTYNRADTLARAIGSVLAQTYSNWDLFILDDGSNDHTADVVLPFAKHNSRIHYHQYATNKGGVAMNEIGMQIAVDHFDIWTRLGSDDWFEPEKLELDYLALAYADACFGPYENEDYHPGAGNYPRDARAELIVGAFCASWANIAMRTEILRWVKARHGHFCDPRLRNMEDWCVNVRAARFTNIIWRGLSVDGKQIAIGATKPEQVPFLIKPDAWYRIDPGGATYAPHLRQIVRDDMALTERLGGEDRAIYIADHIPPVPFQVIARP